MTETFGQRVRRLRRARGWAGDQLAWHAGVSAPAVSFWENDKRLPSPEVLVQLARVLKVSTRYLESGECGREDEILRWASRYSLTEFAKLHNAIRSGVPRQTLLQMISAE